MWLDLTPGTAERGVLCIFYHDLKMSKNRLEKRREAHPSNQGFVSVTLCLVGPGMRREPGAQQAGPNSQGAPSLAHSTGAWAKKECAVSEGLWSGENFSWARSSTAPAVLRMLERGLTWGRREAGAVDAGTAIGGRRPPLSDALSGASRQESTQKESVPAMEQSTPGGLAAD